MKKLPEFFSTQHQLRQLSVMDESSVSTLFGVVDSSKKPMTVELFEANHRGAVKQASVLADVHQAKAALRKEVRQRSAMQTRLARDERRGKKYAASKRKPQASA